MTETQHRFPDHLAAVMPALDEEGSVGRVVRGLRGRGIATVIVADNGSRDATARVAAEAGARVVHEPRRGYGAACQAALAALPPSIRVVCFCDADGADDLERLGEVVDPVLRGEADLVVGSRVRHPDSRDCLTLPQRIGNAVCTSMMRLLYRRRVSDLGPFRCISRGALERMAMSDPAFGWTTEMQVKAFRLSLIVREVDVRPRPRLAGESKISGNAVAGMRAGIAILNTILKYHRIPLDRFRGTPSR